MATPDKWDALFEEEEAPEQSTVEMMAGPDGRRQTVEMGDGFLIVREVRVRPKWEPSLVRRGERPRVGASVSAKTCAHCGAPFRGINRARYCGAADCNRSRTAARVAAHRAAH